MDGETHCEFFMREMKDAIEKDILLSLHLKATMMEVSACLVRTLRPGLLQGPPRRCFWSSWHHSRPRHWSEFGRFFPASSGEHRWMMGIPSMRSADFAKSYGCMWGLF